MMVYGEFLLESVKKTTETLTISGTDNTKYIEFKDVQMMKYNWIQDMFPVAIQIPFSKNI